MPSDVDLENYDKLCEEEHEEKQKQAENSQKNPNNDIVETIRRVILQCRNDLDWSYTKIGAKVGISEEYIRQLLNYKYFPKRAEYQFRLLKKFERLRKEVGEGREDGGRTKNN